MSADADPASGAEASPVPIGPRPYGRLLDGREVQAARLEWEGGLGVEVLEYGATLRSIRAPLASGQVVETLLGFDTLDGYVDDRDFHGRLVGRVANRVADARFDLDGETYFITCVPGSNALHGGRPGFGAEPWTIVEASARRVEMRRRSPDGESGFPGEVEARVVFGLVAADTLEIVWEATTTRATPLNLTHHPYFNLSGRARTTILDHTLQVAADWVTPVRRGLIPTGEFLDVTRTPFDLRQPRVLGEALSLQHPQLALSHGYDLNWVLDPALTAAGGDVCTLRCPANGLALHLATDQPGLQIYSGQGLGHPFVPNGALVLEPQGFPDAPNQPGFPSVTLRPGETYRRFARYRFEAGAPR